MGLSVKWSRRLAIPEEGSFHASRVKSIHDMSKVNVRAIIERQRHLICLKGKYLDVIYSVPLQQPY